MQNFTQHAKRCKFVAQCDPSAVTYSSVTATSVAGARLRDSTKHILYWQGRKPGAEKGAKAEARVVIAVEEAWRGASKSARTCRQWQAAGKAVAR